MRMRGVVLCAALAGGCGSAWADVTVSQQATVNVSCTGGEAGEVCVSTAPQAVLNLHDLGQMLRKSNVTIKSSAAAPDIVIAANLAWANNATLTLDSFHGVTVKNPVSVRGAGGLTITLNDGGSGGEEFYQGKGRVIFWDQNATLIINGRQYMLVHDIASLAAAVDSAQHIPVALMNNYDASADGSYSEAPARDFAVIPFDGLGNSIDNFSIFHDQGFDPKCLALFSGLGEIRNFSMHNASIVQSEASPAEQDRGGILVCNGNAISHVFVSGKITLTGDFSSAGGVALSIAGPARDVHAKVSVQASILGGLAVGNNGTIDRSSFEGRLTPLLHAVRGGGGLVAVNHGTITRSFAKATFTQPFVATNAGGLVGTNDSGTISQSYATGSLTGDRQANIGGLVGLNDNGAIDNSYATGAVTTGVKSNGGGLAGLTNGSKSKITASYSTGAVSATRGTALIGGLLGKDRDKPGSIAAAYWDLDTGGIADPAKGAGNVADDPGIAGLTTDQLKAQLPAGFDPAIWGQAAAINGGLPYLLASPPQ